MRPGEIGEFALIDQVVMRLPVGSHTELGPGDDAAVVRVPDGRVVVSTDVLVEGRHFRRDWSTARDIGRRAVAANVADIAAMGATTTALVVGLAVPADVDVAWVTELADGIAAEASAVGAGVVGGDVVRGDQVVVSITALGDLGGRTAVRRSGARAGDVVALAGRLGWAAAGLAVLSRGFRSPRKVVDAHRVPEPPYAAGPLAAAAGATAMIDVSDGLLADAAHIARASGVCLDIDSQRLTVDAPVRDAAAAYNIDPHVWLLTGGDDHAILATFPSDAVLPDGFTAIGLVVARPTDEAVGADVRVDGQVYDGPAGFDHFR
jgi:thiamine-monophosphate kinase